MAIEVGVAVVVEMGSGDVILQYGRLKSGKAAIDFHQMSEPKELGFVPDERPSGPPALSIRFEDLDAVERLIGNLQHLKSILAKEQK